MKRELATLVLLGTVNSCCPGHDKWPNDTYSNNRSKRRRAKDIKREHRYVRRKLKQLKGEEE